MQCRLCPDHFPCQNHLIYLHKNGIYNVWKFRAWVLTRRMIRSEINNFAGIDKIMKPFSRWLLLRASHASCQCEIMERPNWSGCQLIQLALTFLSRHSRHVIAPSHVCANNQGGQILWFNTPDAVPDLVFVYLLLLFYVLARSNGTDLGQCTLMMAL